MIDKDSQSYPVSACSLLVNLPLLRILLQTLHLPVQMGLIDMA
jgi:hypothetical protein